MGNCITAPFRRNYQNRSGTRAAGRGAAGGGARVAGRGWAQMAPRAGEARLAQGWGSGGAGAAAVGAMRRRGQHEGGRKSPIDGSPPTAMGGLADGCVRGRDAGGEARRI